jgi:hypothetical protein
MKNLLFAALAVTALALAFAAGGRSAPTPESAPALPTAAEKALQALKKRLPDVVAKWAKEVNETAPEVKSVKRLGPEEAKLTLVATDTRPGQKPEVDSVVVIYLRYFDGSWVTTRYEDTAAGPKLMQLPRRNALSLLMLAIDELDVERA